MSILSRFKRLARAGLRHVLDGPTPNAEDRPRIARLAEIVERCKSAIGLCGASLRKLGSQADELAARQADLQRQAEQALTDGDEAGARKLLSVRIELTARLNGLLDGRRRALRINQELFDRMTALDDRLARARSAAEQNTEQLNEAEQQQLEQAEQTIQRLWQTEGEASRLAAGEQSPLAPEHLPGLVDAALVVARKHAGSSRAG